MPLQAWMRKDLGSKAREVLLSRECLGRGYFTKEGIEDLLRQAELGRPLGKEIFSLVTLELLYSQFMDRLRLN